MSTSSTKNNVALKMSIFIVNTPWKALCIFALLPFLLSCISMPFFKLNDLDGWDVRESASSKAQDAWDLAIEDLRISDVEGDAASTAIINGSKTRKNKGPTLTLFIENISGEKNMLSNNGLSYLRWLESKISNEKIWTDNCQLNLNSETMCKPPQTLIEMLNIEVPSFFSSCNNNDDDKDFVKDDCTTISTENRLNLLNHLHLEKYDMFVMNSFKNTNVSSVIQSKYRFGLPVDGYDSADKSLKKQESKVKKQIILLKEWLDTVVVTNKDDFRVYYLFSGIGGYSAQKQLIADGSFATGSILFVLAVMAFHTRSIAIASLGMLQILISFPSTYFFYRLIFQIEHFGTLQVLAIYVILGIGADDIFVLYDAFMQAPTTFDDNTTGESQDEKLALSKRLAWSLTRAVSAMTTTSLTTWAAFVVTAFSPIINIRCFGVFASIMVMVNFLLCIMITPCLIILVHTGQFKCCCDKCNKSTGNRVQQANDEKNDKIQQIENKKSQEKEDQHGTIKLRRVESFFQNQFAPFILKWRVPILLLLIGLVSFFAYFASKLKPSDEQIGNIWPDTHPVKIAYDLQGDEFLKGEGRYLRLRAVFGFRPPGIDRTGLPPFDPTKLGTILWDDDFDMTTEASQSHYQYVVDEIKKVENVRKVDSLMSDMKLFRTMSMIPNPESPIPREYFLKNLSAMLKSPLGARAKGTEMVMYDDNSKLKLVSFIIQMDHPWTWPVSEKSRERDEIDKVLNEANKNGPKTLNGGMQVSSSHVWMDCQLRLTTASTFGLIIAFPLAFVIVFWATKSILTTVAALLTIGSIVNVVLGMMVLAGWALGFMESICVTVIVGLAVDYVVHYSISYTQVFNHKDAGNESISMQKVLNNAVTECLVELGVSVLGGASSTFGAALFLMMCVIKYLRIFGLFLAMTIGSSVVLATIMFPLILSFIGRLDLERALLGKICGDKCIGETSSSKNNININVDDQLTGIKEDTEGGPIATSNVGGNNDAGNYKLPARKNDTTS